MKKHTVHWLVVLAAALVVYNVIVFAVPFRKTGVFFLSWLFTLAALGAQVYVVRSAFYQGEGVKSKFYGFPIAKIGMLYLLGQTVLGLAFMGLASVISVPLWIPLVLYVAALGVAVTGFVAADAVRDEVERQEVVLKKDVSCMRALQSKASSIAQLARDAQLRAVLEKLAEELRFSDPVSSDALRNIEAELTAGIDALHQAVSDGDCEAALALAQKTGTILAERNRLCKLEKGAAR